MFFIDNLKNITKEDELYNYIIQTQDNLQKIIEIQYTKKSTLMQILDKIANIDITKIDISNSQNMLSLIEETKEILDRISDNLSDLNAILDKINEVTHRLNKCIEDKTNDELLHKDIEYVYILYNEKVNMVTEVNLVYERIIMDVYRYLLSETQESGDKKIKQVDKIIEEDKLIIKDDTDNTKAKDIIENKKEKMNIEIVNDDIIGENEKNSNVVENEQKEVLQEEIKNNVEIDETNNNEILPEKIQNNVDVDKANNNKIPEEEIKNNVEIDEKKNDEKKDEKKEIKNEDEEVENKEQVNDAKEKIENNSEKVKTNKSEEEEKEEKAQLNDKSKEDNTKNEKGKKNIENKNIQKEEFEDNNILRISAVDNKVYLPYRVYDLERILNDCPDEYMSISDIVSEKYVVPLNKYKNAAFARFKEAYGLMRTKEQSSFSEAIDVALDVAFKNTLNPAVISACRDLDELDSYLDCLEENKMDEFKAFKVEYEGFPDIKR